MRILCFVAVMCGPASAMTEFKCLAHRDCFTETDCRAHFVTSDVVIDEERGQMFYGQRTDDGWKDEPLVFELISETEKMLRLGLKVGPSPIGVSTLSIFKTSEFILTSAVQIDEPRPDFAVGIVIRGRCELGTS